MSNFSHLFVVSLQILVVSVRLTKNPQLSVQESRVEEGKSSSRGWRSLHVFLRVRSSRVQRLLFLIAGLELLFYTTDTCIGNIAYRLA